MRATSTFSFAAAVAVGCVALSGCGGDAGLNTAPVTGTVTLDGEPLEGAAVSFSPEGDGHAAAGVTDASGEFVLTTETKGDGAVPGTYQVMVTKYEEEDSETPAAAADETDVDAAYAAAEEAGVDISGAGNARATSESNSLVPEKYTNPQTSGLTAEVSEAGVNDYTFELES